MTDSHLRIIYGEGFVTKFPEGLVVPWKPLTMEQFIHYDELVRSGRISLSILEDEIFKLCVLAPDLISRMNKLPGGIISTVATDILLFSGPHDINELNNSLQAVREKYQNSPLAQMATTILWAFPSYKLDDVMALSYQKFIECLIAAEDLLIRRQLLKEPLALVSEGQTTQNKKEMPAEIRAAWERGQKAIQDANNPKVDKEPIPSKPKVEVPSKATAQPAPNRIRRGKESPVFTNKGKTIKQQGIMKDTAAINREGGSDGQGPNDQAIARDKMLNDAQIIYADMLKAMQNKK